MKLTTSVGGVPVRASKIDHQGDDGFGRRQIVRVFAWKSGGAHAGAHGAGAEQGAPDVRVRRLVGIAAHQGFKPRLVAA